MSEQVVAKESVEKALSALKAVAGEDVSKSKNTISSQVPAMVGESGKTQIFATPSDSNPGTWAGSTQTAVASNGATDGVSENGTDYGVAMMKSVLDMVAAGKLDPQVAAILLSKGFPFEKKDEDKKDDDKEDKKDVKKSGAACDDDKDKDKDDVAKSLASSPAVSDAFEVSEFLTGFVEGFAKALTGLENRMSRRFDALESRNTGFQKSLTDALSTVGEATIQNTQRIDSIANLPARGPKSVQVIAKSFDGNTESQDLSRDTVLKSLVALNEKREVNQFEIVRFESSGQISEDTLRKVKAYASAGK